MMDKYDAIQYVHLNPNNIIHVGEFDSDEDVQLELIRTHGWKFIALLTNPHLSVELEAIKQNPAIITTYNTLISDKAIKYYTL